MVMVGLSIRGIKAEFIVIFALGVLFIALGIYGVYYLITVELPTGHYSRLPFAAIGSVLFGLIMMWKSYPIFIPLKETATAQSTACPFCGAIVDETEICGKCKRPSEEEVL